MIFDNYCEETKYLPGIYPCLLRIYKKNASVVLSHAIIRHPDKKSKESKTDRIAIQKELSMANKLKQAQLIVNNINESNKMHNRIWRAEVTDLSLLLWEDRKKILGIDGSCNPTGFEYYSSGIFEVGETRAERTENPPSPYVESFDWRNRHGINWMTSVKSQGNGNGCWAFASVGVTEALVNLYYNNKIDYDLSEQEVISCSGCGTNAGGGYSANALNWISSNGISEEASFPFSNSDEACSNKGSFNELITMNGISSVVNHNTNNNDSVKKALIKHGPLVSGFIYDNGTYHGHAMTLVGYATLHEGDTIRYFSSYNHSPNNFDVIQSGDSRIGKTYWIFKNSYGMNFYYQHQGYSYVLFNDPLCFIAPSYAKVPVSSLLYSDTNIAVTDNDGDGYYFWGIGQKPSHCPLWIPEEPDGDDHDYTKGPLDEYGHLYDIESHVNDIELLPSDTIWLQKRYIYNNIFIPSGVTLIIKNDVVFYNGAKITLRGGLLHIDGGHLYNADIDVDSSMNSHVIISNGGVVDKAVSKAFGIPLGSVFEITNGSIE
jgi:C1A family cysteine protease